MAIKASFRSNCDTVEVAYDPLSSSTGTVANGVFTSFNCARCLIGVLFAFLSLISLSFYSLAGDDLVSLLIDTCFLTGSGADVYSFDKIRAYGAGDRLALGCYVIVTVGLRTTGLTFWRNGDSLKSPICMLLTLRW